METGATVRFLRQNGISNPFIYVPELTPALDVFRGKSHQAGAYGQESLGLAAGHVHFTAGVRQDEDTASPVEVTSPYASASFDPGGKPMYRSTGDSTASFRNCPSPSQRSPRRTLAGKSHALRGCARRADQ